MNKTSINIENKANTDNLSVRIAIAEALEQNIIKPGNNLVLIVLEQAFQENSYLYNTIPD